MAARRPKPLAELSDGNLVYRYQELRYRMIECALDPDHPATVMNRARWTREFKRVELECERRGMFEEES